MCHFKPRNISCLNFTKYNKYIPLTSNIYHARCKHHWCQSNKSFSWKEIVLIDINWMQCQKSECLMLTFQSTNHTLHTDQYNPIDKMLFNICLNSNYALVRKFWHKEHWINAHVTGCHFLSIFTIRMYIWSEFQHVQQWITWTTRGGGIIMPFSIK